MTIGRRGLLAIVFLGLMPVSGAAWGGTPQQTFEELFGKEARQVQAAVDTKGSAEFAAKLLATVDSFKGDDDFKVLLCQKAYEFGVRNPLGYPTALAAAERLALLQPDHKAECDDKILSVRRLAYNNAKTAAEHQAAGQALQDALVAMGDERAQAGQFAEAAALYRQALPLSGLSGRHDEIDAKLKRAVARQAAAEEVTQCKNRLRLNAADKEAARRLVLLYVVDLDDPSEAAPYADLGCDEPTKHCVIAAGMSPDGLPEAALMKLATWYADLADTASAASKTCMFTRAKAYAERFLQVHTAEDLDRVKVNLVKEKADKGLAAVVAAPRVIRPSSGWMDLLKLVDPAKDAVAGNWQLTGGELLSDKGGYARIRLPYKPPDEYDLQVVLARQSGNDTVCLMLAGPGTNFAWMIGAFGNKRCGFALVNGHNANDNPTTSEGALKIGKDCTVLVQVRKDGVKASVDGRLVSQYKTDYKDMSIASNWSVGNTGCLGVGSHASPTVFRSIKVLDVSGKGEVVRDPAAPAAPKAVSAPVGAAAAADFTGNH